MNPRAITCLLAFVCCHCPLLAENLTKPRIEVFKAKRELRLYDGDVLVKTYHIALGSNPVPSKEREGDRATPEGSYFICHKNLQSQYHLSLAISYPGPADAKRGLKANQISKQEYNAILKALRLRKSHKV